MAEQSYRVSRHLHMNDETWAHIERHNKNVALWEARKASLERMAEDALTMTIEVSDPEMREGIDSHWENLKGLRESTDRLEAVLRTVWLEAQQAARDIEAEENP